MKQQIKGGKGDNLNPKNVDPDQLKMGIKIEMEHTNNPKLAKEIAIDHLAEDPKYYSKLKTAKLEHKMNKSKIIQLIEEITIKEMARIPTLYQLSTTDPTELEKLIPAHLKKSGIVKNIIDYFISNNNEPSSTVSVAKAFGYAAQQPVNTQFQHLKAAGVLVDKGLAFAKKERPVGGVQGRPLSSPEENEPKQNVAYILSKFNKHEEPRENYVQWFSNSYGEDKWNELKTLAIQLRDTNLKDEASVLKNKIKNLLISLGFQFASKGRKPTQDLGNFEADEEGNEVPMSENPVRQPVKPATRPLPGIKEPPLKDPGKRPNRRPLTPPDPDLEPRPKNENKGMLKKIVDKYTNLKK